MTMDAETINKLNSPDFWHELYLHDTRLRAITDRLRSVLMHTISQHLKDETDQRKLSQEITEILLGSAIIESFQFNVLTAIDEVKLLILQQRRQHLG